jgi:hypothetical protein
MNSPMSPLPFVAAAIFFSEAGRFFSELDGEPKNPEDGELPCQRDFDSVSYRPSEICHSAS